MHIKFQVNQIISVEILFKRLQKYDFEKNAFNNMFKETKKFSFYLQSAIPGSYKHILPVRSSDKE